MGTDSRRRGRLRAAALAGVVLTGAWAPLPAPGEEAPAGGGGASSPEAAPEDFTGRPGARTVCFRADRPEVGGTACWNVFRLGRGQDPVKDYFVWGLQGSATARGGRRLQRLKLRMVAPGSEKIQAQPGAEGLFDKPENIRVVGGLQPGSRTSATFRVLPGQVHPYAAGGRIYHVSWFDPSGRGVACCPEAQIGAITTWSTAEGTEVMPAELTFEVRYR